MTSNKAPSPRTAFRRTGVFFVCFFPSDVHNEQGEERRGEERLELWEERLERGGLREGLTAKWRGDRWAQRENSRHPPLIASTGLSPSRYAAVHHSITTVLTHPIVDRPEVLYGLCIFSLASLPPLFYFLFLFPCSLLVCVCMCVCVCVYAALT